MSSSSSSSFLGSLFGGASVSKKAAAAPPVVHKGGVAPAPVDNPVLTELKTPHEKYLKSRRNIDENIQKADETYIKDQISRVVIAIKCGCTLKDIRTCMSPVAADFDLADRVIEQIVGDEENESAQKPEISIFKFHAIVEFLSSAQYVKKAKPNILERYRQKFAEYFAVAINHDNANILSQEFEPMREAMYAADASGVHQPNHVLLDNFIADPRNEITAPICKLKVERLVDGCSTPNQSGRGADKKYIEGFASLMKTVITKSSARCSLVEIQQLLGSRNPDNIAGPVLQLIADDAKTDNDDRLRAFKKQYYIDQLKDPAPPLAADAKSTRAVVFDEARILVCARRHFELGGVIDDIPLLQTNDRYAGTLNKIKAIYDEFFIRNTNNEVTPDACRLKMAKIVRLYPKLEKTDVKSTPERASVEHKLSILLPTFLRGSPDIKLEEVEQLLGSHKRLLNDFVSDLKTDDPLVYPLKQKFYLRNIQGNFQYLRGKEKPVTAEISTFKDSGEAAINTVMKTLERYLVMGGNPETIFKEPYMKSNHWLVPQLRERFEATVKKHEAMTAEANAALSIFR